MKTEYRKKQECIPVGCVPPALCSMGVSLTETPWTENPQRAPPLEQGPPPTLLWTESLRLRAVKSFVENLCDTAIGPTRFCKNRSRKYCHQSHRADFIFKVSESTTDRLCNSMTSTFSTDVTSTTLEFSLNDFRWIQWIVHTWDGNQRYPMPGNGYILRWGSTKEFSITYSGKISIQCGQ